MNKKKLIIIILSIIAFLLIAGLVLFFVLKDNDKDEKKGTKEVTKITITFDSAGGTKVDDITVKKGESFQLPETEKEGYLFAGWYNGSTLYTDDDTASIKKNIVLTAKWEEVEEDDVILTVTFDSNGGSKVKDMTFKCVDGAATLKNLPTSKKDAYEFRAWEDKFGKAILNGAKITCEGKEPTLKLYAGWEYDGPVANPNQNPDDSKTLKCPTGYTLNAEAKKCTIEGTVSEKCPDGTKTDGSLCIKTNDSNAGTRQCKEDTVAYDGKGHTWTGRGDYYMVGNSYGKCAYYKWTGDNYNTKSKCEAAYDVYHKTVWVSELNGCYAETKMNNYETVCASDYLFYSSSDLSSKFGIHDNGKCLRKVAKEKYCAEGYTLTSGKCIKTIDATLE